MQTLKMDFQSQSTPPVVPVMQSDAQSRFIGLTLYDGGVPYSAPSGAQYTVQYRGSGANNMGWYDTIQLSSGTRKAVVVSSSSPNVVTLELAEQALRVNGKVEVSLCVVNNTGYKLNTFPIICRVTGAPYVDPVAVRSYFYVTGLTSEQWLAYVTACQDAQKRAEDAAAKLVIDSTLTQEGQAADAKAVGQIKEDLNILQLANTVTYKDGFFINPKNGEEIVNDSYSASNYIYIGDCKKIKISVNYKFSAGIAFYTNKKIYISGYDNSESLEYGSEKEIEVPYNAKYLRISNNKKYTPSVKKAEADTLLESSMRDVITSVDNGVIIAAHYSTGYINDDLSISESKNAVHTEIIALPSRACKVQIVCSKTYKHKIFDIYTESSINKIYDITDSTTPVIIDGQFFMVSIYDTSWSGNITADDVQNNVVIKVLTNDYTLPKYYINEIETVRNSFQSRSELDGFNFVFITDTHFEYSDPSTHLTNEDVVKRELNSIVEIANTANVDCIIHGGDLIHGASIGTETAYKCFEETVQILSNAKKPVFFCFGNHDDNSARSGKILMTSIVTHESWMKRLSNALNPKVLKSYFYYDFENKKTRLIILDPYDYTLDSDSDGNALNTANNTNQFSKDQLNWLENTALANVPSGFQVVIALHGVLVDGTGETKVKNAQDVVNIIDNYNISAQSKIYNVVYGHTHSDIYSKSNGVNYICTGAGGIANGIQAPPTHTISDYARPKREKFTISEALFDVFSVKKERVLCIRFGAGNSREYS